MLRGVITFTHDQIEDLVSYVSKQSKDSMLYIKLIAGKELNRENIPVELSEDELELILDEMGIDGKKELRELINENLLKWRS